MKGTETSWKSKDNVDFFGQYWAPEGSPKAVVCLVHGLGEHSGRYDHVGEMLTGNGIALFGMDHRGHGKSGGKRGYFPSYEAAMADVDLLLEQAAAQFPGVPQYLYGHSMGGNLVTNHLLRNPGKVAGAIVTAPWLVLDPPPPGFKVFLAKVMNLIYPSYQDSNGLDVNHLSKNASVVQAYIDDPLVHDKICAGSFLAIHEAAGWAMENAAKIKQPMLLMHGKEDKITSPKGSEKFANRAGKLVDLKLWEGMYHEIHNEIKKGLVLAAIKDWLEAKIS